MGLKIIRGFLLIWEERGIKYSFRGKWKYLVYKKNVKCSDVIIVIGM